MKDNVYFRLLNNIVPKYINQKDKMQTSLYVKHILEYSSLLLK
tara:strand:+ start:535 stop:663 length:129 start_codon:yes stop_codon:yes gene_type:complete